MKTLLVVIDMQKDFITGALPSAVSSNFVKNVHSIINKGIVAGWDVVFTQDTHGENYLDTQEGRKLPIKHCIKGTDGWEIVPELYSLAIGNKIFEKNGFGCQDLIPYAKKYDIIRLIGVCTDICVITNGFMLKGAYPEKQLIVMEKGCGGSSVEKHDEAIKILQHCQIEIES